jgi:hypothetical protein
MLNLLLVSAHLVIPYMYIVSISIPVPSILVQLRWIRWIDLHILMAVY